MWVLLFLVVSIGKARRSSLAIVALVLREEVRSMVWVTAIAARRTMACRPPRGGRRHEEGYEMKLSDRNHRRGTYESGKYYCD